VTSLPPGEAGKPRRRLVGRPMVRVSKGDKGPCAPTSMLPQNTCRSVVALSPGAVTLGSGDRLPPSLATATTAAAAPVRSSNDANIREPAERISHGGAG
jgi:hypothetical protein